MKLGMLTVEVELGPETRALVERVVERSALQIELGPKTRELLASALPSVEQGSRSSGSSLADIYRRLRP